MQRGKGFGVLSLGAVLCTRLCTVVDVNESVAKMLLCDFCM